MPTSPDILSKLGDLQNPVWQTASVKVSEALGFEVQFSNPLTVSVPAADVFAESTSPRLVVQFSFAGVAESTMVLLIPRETYGGMSTAVKGAAPEEVDESLVPDVKPLVEAIVQGICLAVTNTRGEPVIASDLGLRFQIPVFPPNLQRAEDVIRTNVGVSSEDFNGTITWLMDGETACNMLGIDYDDSQAGGTVGSSKASSETSADESSLDIIMDIPLEVSVELGRVKMQVRDVVELGAGSIVEIDKAAGEPVDVLVNGRLVARGEVVVIDDNFGVRITEILSIQERLQKLNEAA